VELRHELTQKDPGPLAKTINDLAPYLGKETAVKLAVDIYSGEKDKKKGYTDILEGLIRNATAGGSTVDAAKMAEFQGMASRASDYYPKGTAAPAGGATGEFSLQSLIGKVNQLGKTGGKTFFEEDKSLGLIGGETSAPATPVVDKRSPEMKAAQDNLRGAASKIKAGFSNARERAEEERLRLEEDRKKKEAEEAVMAKNR
jgi:hypothetical protein